MCHSTNVDKTTPMSVGDSIANIITDFKATEDVIDATEMAYMKLFTSDSFTDSDVEFKDSIAFNYRLLMDVLRKIAVVERVQYCDK